MKKHKMVIHIEIPLNVETEQEANEQMIMLMQANAKEFDCIGDMVRLFNGAMRYIELKNKEIDI